MKRRTLLLGSGAALVAAGGAAWVMKPFRKQYPPSPYDDILAKVDDREWAAKFGVLALAAMPDFTANNGAARLRPLLNRGSLSQVAMRDAEAGRLMEIHGWLVPESIVLMAALAKSAEATTAQPE
jgi:hypothetical protein